MYWIAKIFQASALTVMAWGFIKNYPHLMPYNIILVSGVLFIAGWVVQTYMLRSK